MFGRTGAESMRMTVRTPAAIKRGVQSTPT